MIESIKQASLADRYIDSTDHKLYFYLIGDNYEQFMIFQNNICDILSIVLDYENLEWGC